MSSIKGYKCPHCEYYMWEGKEFYECEFQDKVSKLEQENVKLKFELDVIKADYEASEQENAELKEKNTALEETLQTIEQLKDEDSLRIAQLVTENAELKAYKDVNEDFKTAWEELKAENERLKALCDTYRTCYQAKHSDIKCLLPKYRTTLQEIKAIAEALKPFIDFSETKTATEVEYDYAAICNELELRLHKVLELIIKAESEG